MDATFHAGADPEGLQQLYARRNGPGLIRLIVQVVFAAVSGALVVLAPGPWHLAAALALHAVAHVSFFGTLHECAHRTAFRSPLLNHPAGWIAAVFQLMSPNLMRALHFEHHRFTHDLERDPELGGLAFMARWPRGAFWLANASGLPILVARIAMTLTCAAGAPGFVASRLLPYLRPKHRWAVAASSLALVAVHATLVAAALQWEPRLLRHYLAVPISHALLSLYIACEHRGLPTDGPVLARTRSFAASPLTRWLFWNMPYHAEHHAYPAVPFHALPQLHAALAPALVHRTRGPLWLHLTGGRG